MSMKDLSIRLSLKDGETVRRALMQLGNDGQAALAKIEKQSAPASKGLLAVNAVSRELQGSMQASAGRIGLVGAGLGAIGPAGLVAAAGVAAAVTAVTGLVRASVNAANQLAAIKDEAQQAGTAVETFQALRYAAEDYSVSQEALTDGLKELNLRADEWIKTGKGPAEEAFRRLGFTQEELQGKLGDTGELFLDVVAKAKNLESEAARLRVADEIFGGTGGEQFVRMITAGEEAIRRLMDQARDAGYVIDANLIERADETRDRMNQLQRLIDLQLNQALVDLAPVALGVAEAFADVARFVSSAVDSFRDLDSMSTRGLEGRLTDANAAFDEEMARIEPQLDALLVRREQIEGLMSRAREAGDQARVDNLTRYLSDLDARMAEIRSSADAIAMQRDEIAAQIESRNTSNSAPARVLGETGDSKAEAEKIEKVTEALRFQLDQVNRTALSRKLFVELQRAGIDANHAEAATLAELTQKLYQAEIAQNKNAEAKRNAEQMTKSLMTAEEKRTAALEEINRLVDQDLITQETANRAREEAARNYETAERRKLDASREWADGAKRAFLDYTDNATNAAAATEQAVTSGMNSMTSNLLAFTNGTKTAKDSFTDFATSVVNDIARIVIQQQISGPAAQAIGGWFNSLFSASAFDSSAAHYNGGRAVGSYGVGSFHTGGIVGDGRGARNVPLSLFSDAERYHSGGFVGLKSGERPIIALDRERVLTEAQQENTAKTISSLANMSQRGKGEVVINVNNNAGRVATADASVREGRNGGFEIDVLVEEIESRMGQNVARGEGMAGVLEGRYLLNPAAGARR